ncbi:flagellar hook protein FlgE [Sphingomonas solaris]|uniref:Flagellar hook protein FlgE n=1 Tax=Alterirhizorhabdus solaris TaxID=2529389 RepID=A0A558QUX1_9SPHN|nr:flagellar hook protein FlgE [Sphingomonas solaris]TVV70925.1 flagellar hook protein FlgE [Sphingomonas solaris]
MSFYTSLSGLKAAQTDLSVISNNVANVSSNGFKKSRADFGDLVSNSSLQAASVAGQGARLKSITQQFTQGSGMAASERALDLAISGQGFFVTSSDQTGGGVAFTRNGAFGVDNDRYVTDSRGNYLQVMPVDTSGGVTATGLAAAKSLQVPLTSGDAKPTSRLDIKLNLPAAADLPANRAVYQAPATYAFDRYDPNSYNYSAQTTVYDADGNGQPATIYYTRTAAPTASSTDSTWEARMFVGNAEASSTKNADGTGTSPAVPLSLTFDDKGVIKSPVGDVSFGAALPSGAAAPISLTLNYGTASTQAAGTFKVASLTQDGVEAGTLSNVSVGNDGLVSASYSNGTTQKLGKVMIANFSNPSGLRQMGDATWGASGDSGPPVVGEASSNGNGQIQSGALELSNVDITDELVALIAAQRNFQANAKAIETANTLTQTIIQTN